MAVIDSDAHVVESERTWDFIPEELQHLRPIVLLPKEGYKSPSPEFWYIDNRAFTKGVNVGLDTDEATREASDIAKRLAHMDELEVNTHVSTRACSCALSPHTLRWTSRSRRATTAGWRTSTGRAADASAGPSCFPRCRSTSPSRRCSSARITARAPCSCAASRVPTG